MRAGPKGPWLTRVALAAPQADRPDSPPRFSTRCGDHTVEGVVADRFVRYRN